MQVLHPLITEKILIGLHWFPSSLITQLNVRQVQCPAFQGTLGYLPQNGTYYDYLLSQSKVVVLATSTNVQRAVKELNLPKEINSLSYSNRYTNSPNTQWSMQNSINLYPSRLKPFRTFFCFYIYFTIRIPMCSEL